MLSTPKRATILGLILVSFAYFLWWSLTVVLPVATTEISYQLKRATNSDNLFTSLKKLLVPQFSFAVDLAHSNFPKAGLTIPSVYLDEPIIFDVSPTNESEYLAALKHGIAHARGTSYPGEGKFGYYFAHSSSPSLVTQYNAVFYLLGKLKKGDEIVLWKDSKPYHYRVSEIRITDPKDTAFFGAEYPKETIVLQTCWPPGSMSKRLLVFATRV
jgi:LPXTG-site transpeptidase (sortase) family protein